MLEEALSYAVRGEPVRRSLVGGLLVLTAVLVVPAVVLAGYLSRILEQPPGETVEPPSFAEWRAYLAPGLVGGAVWLAYTVVPAAIAGGLFSAWAAGVGPVSGAESDLAFGLVFSALVLVVLTSAALAPAAVAVATRGESIAAGFAIGAVVRVARRRDYVEATLLSIAIWAVVAAGIVMLFVTVFGLLLVPVIVFLALVSLARLYGLATAPGTDGTVGTAGSHDESVVGR